VNIWNALNRNQSKEMRMQEITGKSVALRAVALVCFFLPASLFASSVPVGQKPTPNPEPFARRISLPPLKLLASGSALPQTFEPRSWRFSYICVMGSWRKGTDTLHNYFQKHHDFMNRRKIAAVAAFSHETPENVAAWADKTKPRYIFGLAQTEFIDKLNNPKLPTCWLISREGQILFRQEMPTEADLVSVYEKLKLWTDF
jgi:hypothetical protein